MPKLSNLLDSFEEMTLPISQPTQQDRKLIYLISYSTH